MSSNHKNPQNASASNDQSRELQETIKSAYNNQTLLNITGNGTKSFSWCETFEVLETSKVFKRNYFSEKL
jgi:hypothetical protein